MPTSFSRDDSRAMYGFWSEGRGGGVVGGGEGWKEVGGGVGGHYMGEENPFVFIFNHHHHQTPHGLQRGM